MISLNLEYNIKENKFNVNTNLKKGKVADIIENFLIEQIGKGNDESQRNEQDIYNIEINLDLKQDTFFCKHDCGNDGLRDGILLYFLQTKDVK